MVLENIKKLSLLVFLIGISLGTAHAQKAEKMIRKETFALWGNVELVQVMIDPGFSHSCTEFQNGDEVFQIRENSDSNIKGFVLSTSAMGRFDAFDYFLIFNKELEVQLVRVVVYRSSHGSAICSKRWLKQFAGYSGGEISYGKR